MVADGLTDCQKCGASTLGGMAYNFSVNEGKEIPLESGKGRINWRVRGKVEKRRGGHLQ